MVSVFADTILTFETVPAFNFEMNDKYRPTDEENIIQSHMNNTATRNIHSC